MKIESILKQKSKGSQVVTVRPDESIDALAHRLVLEGIGCVIVSENGQTIDGIISERDLIRGLAQHGTGLLDMPVSRLMSLHVLTCTPDDRLKDVMRKMTQRRVRHLPVVDGGRLAGIISIGDVVKNRLEDMELEASVLRDMVISH